MQTISCQLPADLVGSILRTMKPHALTLSVAIGLLSMAGGRSSGFEFTVEGEVRVSMYSRGNLANEAKYNFTAEIRDCQSRIRVFGGWLDNSEYFEYGCDGKTAYSCVKFWTDRVPISPVQAIIPEKEQLPLNSEVSITLPSDLVSSDPLVVEAPVPSSPIASMKPVNEASVSIHASDVPQEHRIGITPVWLAYGSRCHYLERKSGNMVEPVWRMPRESPGRERKFTSTWSINESHPGLLQSMTDFVMYPPPFNEDVTNSVYSVVSWTNVSGMNLPLSFQVVQHSPLVGVHQYRVYEGVAHSIRPTCEVTDFFPASPVSVPTSVVDNRLASDQQPARKVDYLSNTGEIVIGLDELKQRDLDTKVKARPTD